MPSVGGTATLLRPAQQVAPHVPQILFMGHSYVEGDPQLIGAVQIYEGNPQAAPAVSPNNGWQGTLFTTRGSPIVNVVTTQAGTFGNGMRLNGPAIPDGCRALSLAAPVASLSSALSTGGGAITSLPINAIQDALPSGVVLTVASGANTQTWTTTAAATPGATSLTVTSQVPGFNYPINSPLTAAQISDPATRSFTSSPAVGGMFLERWSTKVARACHAVEYNIGIGGAKALAPNPTTGGYASPMLFVPRTKPAAPYVAHSPVVIIMIGLNDIGYYSSLQRGLHGIRTMITWGRAGYVIEDSNGLVTYTGTWSGAGSSNNNSGNQAHLCNTSVGSAAVHVPAPSDMKPGQAITMVFELVEESLSPNCQGVIQFAQSSTVLGTVDTRLVGITDNVPVEIALPRLVCGNGTYLPGQTIDITFPTAPGEVIFDCAVVEAEHPPLTLLLKQPHLPTAGYVTYATQTDGGLKPTLNDSRIDQFNAGLDALAAEFPNNKVQTVDLSMLNDDPTLFGADGIHPNFKGYGLIASQVIQKLQGANLSMDEAQNYAGYFIQ